MTKTLKKIPIIFSFSLYINYTLAKFDTDSLTRFPCRPYNDGATWMTLFFMRTSILYPFFEGAFIKPSIMLNSLKFIYFVRCLLSVLKVNCKIIIDLYQKPPEKNHKTVDPEWMKERTNKSMLLFPIFLLYILIYTLTTTTITTKIIIIIIIITIVTVITVTSLHILYRGIIITGIWINEIS